MAILLTFITQSIPEEVKEFCGIMLVKRKPLVRWKMHLSGTNFSLKRWVRMTKEWGEITKFTDWYQVLGL